MAGGTSADERVVYEVSARVAPELRERYERYMRERHVADVMATGAFVSATLERGEGDVYRVRYVARSRPALEAYLAGHAGALRADFLRELPDGVQLTREILRTLARWEEEALRLSR